MEFTYQYFSPEKDYTPKINIITITITMNMDTSEEYLMNSENNVAILVVAFLSTPETFETQLRNSKQHFFYTQNAFFSLQKKVNSKNLFLGLVGDENECAYISALEDGGVEFIGTPDNKPGVRLK